jgi:hypothetical protein
MQQVAKEFIIFDRFSESRQFRSEASHLSVVLISSQRQFLGVIEFTTKMPRLGARRCLEHGVDSSPGLGSGRHLKQM